MIIALTKGLSCSREDAMGLITKYGGPVQAAQVVLTWDTVLANGKWMKRDLITRAMYQVRLHTWAHTWEKTASAPRFVADASPFEFHVTFHVNPFYPLYAFRVPLKACMELIKDEKIPYTSDAFAYALVLSQVQSKKFVSKLEVRTLFQQNGIPWKEPTLLEPFPDDIFHDHALKEVNMFTLAPGQAIQHAPRQGISVLRERKEMCNRLLASGESEETRMYKISEGSQEFAALMHLYNRPL
jgi:hypothetical protein